MRCDFHLHTTASDGDLEPAALLPEIARGRLAAWAITDHDTLAGYRALAPRPGLVPGVEVSCWFEGREVHVVGLGLAPDDPTFAAFLAGVRAARHARLALVIEAVERLHPGALADVLPPGRTDRVLTRRHLATVLVARGVVPHPPAAYADLLGDQALVDLPPPALPGPTAAAAAIAAAGGVSILAHPGVLGDIDAVERLMVAGLDGVERRHPRLPRDLRGLLDRLSRRRGWLSSCGSDAHTAPGHRRLGDWSLPREELAPLLERLEPAGADAPSPATGRAP